MLEINLGPGEEGSQPTLPKQGYNSATKKDSPNSQPQPHVQSERVNRATNIVKSKAFLTIIAIALIGFLLFLVINGIKKSIGTKEKTLPVVSRQLKLNEEASAEEEEALSEENRDAILKKLQDENELLRRQIAELKKEYKLEEEEIEGLPVGVTRLDEFKKGDTTVLNYKKIRQFKELVPYTKQYKRLNNGDYYFSILVKYGNQSYNIPVTFLDYSKMKPSGVTSLIVEFTEVQNPENSEKVDILTNLAIDPKWEQNISPK